MGLLQVRVDDDLKKEASEVYEKLGMDLSTAVRVFLKKSVMMKGIPFDVSISEETSKIEEKTEKIFKQEPLEIDEDKKILDMSYDEINLIIEQARRQKK